MILDAARTLDDGNPLVFPTVRGKLMNDMTLSGLLRTLESPAVPHGLSLLRDPLILQYEPNRKQVLSEDRTYRILKFAE